MMHREHILKIRLSFKYDKINNSKNKLYIISHKSEAQTDNVGLDLIMVLGNRK